MKEAKDGQRAVESGFFPCAAAGRGMQWRRSRRLPLPPSVTLGLVWGFCCQGRLLAAFDRLVGAARMPSRLPGRPPCAQADWPASSYTAERCVPYQDAPCAEPVGGLGGGPNLVGGVFQP